MAVFGKRVLGAVAAFCLTNTLLKQTAACSCVYDHICDDLEAAGVVLRASILATTEEYPRTSLFVDYSVETITVFKGEDGIEYGEGVTFNFTTIGDGATCGIFLGIDEEYLLDLWQDAAGRLWTMGQCGLTRTWSSVTDEDLVFLEDMSACDVDPCAEEPCGEFQECLPWERSRLHPDNYYCADVCDPSPCDAHETCELVSMTSCPSSTFSSGLCPDTAICVDPCNGTCDEFQECTQFRRTGEWYCSDMCDDGACEEGEQCKTRKRKWCRRQGRGCPRKRKCF